MKAILFALSIALGSAASAQIKHAATATVLVHGNNEQCKPTIEAAAAQNQYASASWNSANHLAVITWDSTRTTLSAVLKNIALAGYDNDQYLAPDAVYAQLPACCQYTRTAKKAPLTNGASAHTSATASSSSHSPAAENTAAHALAPVINAYLLVKDALVNSAASEAATQAKQLTTALAAVDMKALAHEQHMVWMKEKNSLTEIASAIAAINSLEKQRVQFAALSAHLYPVVKAGGAGRQLYYQHCPMFEEGADWLSQEKTVRNPYYGSQMLTCGKTTETIP